MLIPERIISSNLIEQFKNISSKSVNACNIRFVSLTICNKESISLRSVSLILNGVSTKTLILILTFYLLTILTV